MAASQRDKHLHDWVSATYQLTVGFPGRQTPEQLGQTASRRLLEGREPARGGAYGDSTLGPVPPGPLRAEPFGSPGTSALLGTTVGVQLRRQS